jgi:hypothetical protein
MTTYDLCIAWNWEYDAQFIALLEQVCRERQLSFLQIKPDNLEHWLRELDTQQIAIRAFIDRASEEDARFMPLVQRLQNMNILYINPHEQALRSRDKAAMHPEFIHAGLYAPYTIILPPYAEQPVLPFIDISPLGREFTIKPAQGSGGEGVINKATTWQQVLSVRQEHSVEQYLLQNHVVPRQLNDHPAWFRVIYCTGKVYPCWWHPHTHIYTPVTIEENEHFGLQPLRDETITIASLCGLDLFSTEIAFTTEGLFVVVDYVNDPIDLRIQSKMHDGIPDYIVHDIAERLVSRIL